MKHFAAVGVVFFFGCLAVACQSPSPTAISVPPLTAPSTPPTTRTPSPGPAPLTDAEAIALIEKEATNRGVSPATLRIAIKGEPRSASIRYSSPYEVDSKVFQVQMMFVALTAADAVARVQPSVKGGMRLAVVPGGEGEVGLRVIIIDWDSLEAWADGAISDREFISQWTRGAVTRE